LNRQIRRMCEYLGYEVRKLERIRIMNIGLKGLPPGDWRELTKEEVDVIYSMVEDSTSEDGKESRFKKQESRSKKPKCHENVPKQNANPDRRNRFKRNDGAKKNSQGRKSNNKPGNRKRGR
jgi:23S rRNA pseudouridine2604 synthase